MARCLIVVMGPSGCGKSSVAQELGRSLNAPIIEGDDFHPPSNVAKMTAGQPLDDNDRRAWLDGIAAQIGSELAAQIVVACSALTPFVQDRLRELPRCDTRFFLLNAPPSVLKARIEKRPDHFMPASLIESQFEALDPPFDAVSIDAEKSVEAITRDIIAELEQCP